jgi:hydroxymethylglutaryl-CoA reductase (NADPH)
MNLRDYSSVSLRRYALEKELRIDLKHIGTFTLDETVASTRNCENMIGTAQIPMGIAGPLRLDKHDYYIPLATTEGALVASVSRGCKSITESGGAVTDCHRVGATRGPVFRVNSLRDSDRLYRFLKEHLDELKNIAKKTSRHLTLEKLLTRGVGRYRYVRFVFDTEDAMGMNMVTIASDALAKFIGKETGVTCIALAGNFDIDKKPAWLNFIENRGTKVWAEVTIPAAVIQKVLKTTAQKMNEVWLSKCMIGSAMAGSMGFNAQFANVIAAIFLATGQDAAHIGEGSMGITTTEVIRGKDLYISVYLPDLMVGTVGGGTGLATQKEAFSILGATHSTQFAEVIAGAVLAGEISLIASLAEGSLVQAHKILARGGK